MELVTTPIRDEGGEITSALQLVIPISERKHLEARLSTLKKHPWWSMGMARLVEMVRDEGDRVRARTLALDCYKAFSNAVGGRRCRRHARRAGR